MPPFCRLPGGATVAEDPVFDRAVALERLDPEKAHGALRWRGHTAPEYGNRIGPFGGITAAQALQAVLQHPERLGDPIALTVNFAAPIADGEFVLAANPIRTNRSTQHWLLTMTQETGASGRAVVLTASAITGVRRSTWGVTEAGAPHALKPHSVARAPDLPAVAPAFLSRYDVRWLTGALPKKWDGIETEDSVTRLWLRDDPPRPLDFASLTAMCDFFYPRIMLRRSLLVPSGTVSLTVYYHAGTAELAQVATGYLLGEASGQRFFNGYFDQRAALWSEAGDLLASTHQMVYYKDPA